MKTMLLIFILPCFTQILNAQTDYPFPHNNAIWGQFEGVYVNNLGADYYFGSTHFYVAKGDSLLNSYSYIKMYASDSMGNLFNSPPRLIREQADKVYYFLADEQLDTLLYDFSLQPGDTAHCYSDLVFPDNIIVDSVGVIQTGNQLRKCLYFNHTTAHAIYNQLNYDEADYSPIIWMEGIGSNDGLFVPYGGTEVIDGISFLTCFKENDTLKYGNECNLIYDGYEEVSISSGIGIFPNPTSGNIIIQAGEMKGETEIVIHSLLGEEALRKTIQPTTILYETLDLSLLSKGCYFVTIKSAGINYTEIIQIVR